MTALMSFPETVTFHLYFISILRLQVFLNSCSLCFLADCDVHSHYAAGSGATGQDIPAATSSGVHWISWQTNRACRTNCVHPVRGRQEAQVAGDPGTWGHTSSHHIREPKEGRGRAGERPGEARGEFYKLFLTYVERKVLK